RHGTNVNISFLVSQGILLYSYGQAKEKEKELPMETLYYNGVIRTMVSHIPEEALLVRDGRIEAVGEFGPLLEANPYVRKVDLQGGCLMPAFLDAHSHIV